MISKQKIRIVTDSVADMPLDLLEKWQITLVPTFVNYNQQSYADDGVELDRTAYYHHLQNKIHRKLITFHSE